MVLNALGTLIILLIWADHGSYTGLAKIKAHPF